MARAPFNVLVFPYRSVGGDVFKYALLKRSDAGFWQGIAGGGENGETVLEAVKRETHEESGIPPDSLFLPLDTIEPVPVTYFRDSHLWGEDIYVIPQYCFGVLVKDSRLVLSPEHTEYRWLPYEEAHRMLEYDGNRTALWELDKRLRGRGPRGNCRRPNSCLRKAIFRRLESVVVQSSSRPNRALHWTGISPAPLARQ